MEVVDRKSLGILIGLVSRPCYTKLLTDFILLQAPLSIYGTPKVFWVAPFMSLADNTWGSFFFPRPEEEL